MNKLLIKEKEYKELQELLKPLLEKKDILLKELGKLRREEKKRKQEEDIKIKEEHFDEELKYYIENSSMFPIKKVTDIEFTLYDDETLKPIIDNINFIKILAKSVNIRYVKILFLLYVDNLNISDTSDKIGLSKARVLQILKTSRRKIRHPKIEKQCFMVCQQQRGN